ncbi:MAG: rRNA maturation RNase YbeY [Candidatus Omnitrophota bacterium]|nr:rRNA maturation RNase YbeY [Candidatus Omnitrophota bacterium]
MTLRINSENRNKKIKIDLSKAKKVARTALRALGKDDVELNIVFISDQKIRALNRAYLDEDAATDVIAFPPGEERFGRKAGGGKRKKIRFLGDVAISSDRAAQNSRVYGLSLMEEAALYIIHGILHLAGREDRTRKGRGLMRRQEDEILQEARKVF